MTKVKLKPVKVKVSARRVGNRTAITTTINGKSKTKYVK